MAYLHFERSLRHMENPRSVIIADPEAFVQWGLKPSPRQLNPICNGFCGTKGNLVQFDKSMILKVGFGDVP